MSAIRRLKLFCLLHFSKPQCDRILYRAICRQRAASILEIGLSDGRRALRMIRLAGERHGAVRYAAVDSFEARTGEEGRPFPLKEAYRQFKAAGARVRLLPGTPYSALAAAANQLGQFDLVIVSATAAEAMRPAWFYLPRMLHEGSLVFVEERMGSGSVFKQLPLAEVERLAARPRRAAA